MAKLSIVSVSHEAGWFEGVMGQGIPIVSAVALERGELVTAGGAKASSADSTLPPVGYVGWATGDYAKVVANQTFRAVRDAFVYMDTAKAPGTPIYLSDTAGEFSDVAGTVKFVVGYYVADSEANVSTSNMACLEIRPLVNA